MGERPMWEWVGGVTAAQGLCWESLGCPVVSVHGLHPLRLQHPSGLVAHAGLSPGCSSMGASHSEQPGSRECFLSRCAQGWLDVLLPFTFVGMISSTRHSFKAWGNNLGMGRQAAFPVCRSGMGACTVRACKWDEGAGNTKDAHSANGFQLMGS